jgi:CelD/BcsL family acetyltransferase involved in cellulose biosynthesis
MATNVETLAAPLSVEARRSGRAASLDVYAEFDDARADWDELLRVAAVSPYQSCRFLSVWFETLGRFDGAVPFIVVARDAEGRPQALLPLCLYRRGPLKVALFLGGRESNFNLPLLRPGARYDEAALRALLVEASRRAPVSPDLFYLRNQPKRFEGVDNPLAFANARRSASDAYGVSLPERVEDLAERLSKDARKKLRKKEARLAEFGEIAYEHCATGNRAQEILTALIEQKAARFSDKGVDLAYDASRLEAFLKGLVDGGGLELHALSVGGRIVAAYAGVVRGARFSAMINSFDMDEEIARSSPGDLLLHALMRNLVGRGMTAFDLGAGEARYKNAVCDETIELCDVIAPISAQGALAAPLFSAFLRLKRRVKQTPALSRAYYRLRGLIRAKG